MNYKTQMSEKNCFFKEEIFDWGSWGKVFQSSEAFWGLIKHIYNLNDISLESIEKLTPGTNAVFKIGETVCKIFAPKESGVNPISDYETELFGIKRANDLNISAPKLLASGCVCDKYDFLYLIMEHIKGEALGDIEKFYSDTEKLSAGQKLRKITPVLNVNCEQFNDIDIIERALTNKRWDIFPDSFNLEREAYLTSLKSKEPINKVYVHGDLNPNNVLVSEKGELVIIDFADAVSAPMEYELAAIVFELFCFEKPYLTGFFGAGYETGGLVQKCFEGVILHDFGAGMIKCNLGDINEITDLGILKKRIETAIINGRGLNE